MVDLCRWRERGEEEGKSMGERMLHGAVRVIEKHHGGTGPCVHPELLGTESNG